MKSIWRESRRIKKHSEKTNTETKYNNNARPADTAPFQTVHLCTQMNLSKANNRLGESWKRPYFAMEWFECLMCVWQCKPMDITQNRYNGAVSRIVFSVFKIAIIIRSFVCSLIISLILFDCNVSSLASVALTPSHNFCCWLRSTNSIEENRLVSRCLFAGSHSLSLVQLCCIRVCHSSGDVNTTFSLRFSLFSLYRFVRTTTFGRQQQTHTETISVWHGAPY